MKFLHAAAFAVILTVAGSPALRAQEPDQDKEKPKQQEEDKKKQPPAKEKAQPRSDERKADERKPDERKPDERKPDERKPDDRAKTEPDRDKSRQETDRQNQAQRQDNSARREQDRPEPQANRNDSEHHERRTNVRRIPEESFRVSFGREHHFHVARRDDRRFIYGGYTFEYVDAWPPGWSYDDDCYIEQNGDDYYLMNARRPGARVLVVIVA